MPEGLVRPDVNTGGASPRNGTPVTLPINFGQPVTLPHQFGITIPNADPTTNSNPVTWQPSPAHFGSTVVVGISISGFQLEDGSGVLLLESGDILLLEQ